MTDTPPRPVADGFRWWALGVAIVLAVSIAWQAFQRGPGTLPTLALVGLSVFFSKLLIFQGAIDGHPYSPWSLALISWEMDLLASTLLLLWVVRLERLAVVGPALRQAHERAVSMLKQYPGLKRMALSGIALFVLVPFPGSGAVVGTLVGQLVGLSRSADFLAVAIGSCLTVAMYAAAADLLGERWRGMLQSPLILAVSCAILLIFGWIAWRRVKRVLSSA